MNRRQFIGRSVAVAGIGLISLPEVGCISPANLASLAQTLGNASANVATLEGNTNLAAQITTYTNSAVTAITNWKSGTPTNDVIEAIGILQSALSLVPQLGAYATLIDIALSTIQTILALLPAATITPNAPVSARKVRVVYLSYPKKNGSDANVKEFKAHWNAVCATDTRLAKAVIN